MGITNICFKFQKSELEEVYRQLKEMVAHLQGQGQRHDRPKVTVTSWEDEVRSLKIWSTYGYVILTVSDAKKWRRYQCNTIGLYFLGHKYVPNMFTFQSLYLLISVNEPFTLKSIHTS